MRLHVQKELKIFDILTRNYMGFQEIWLCQVREMQRHCEYGLQVVHYSAAQSMENQFAVEYISR